MIREEIVDSGKFLSDENSVQGCAEQHSASASRRVCMSVKMYGSVCADFS